MDLRVAAYAVVERRGKILLTHWRRGHLHGWTLPGGGLEAGEDPRDAVVREVEEETGLDAKVGKLLGVDSRVMVREEVPEGVDPELHTIRIVYRATVNDGPLRNEIGGSSDEARWVPLREVKSLRTLSLVQTGLRMAGISLRKPAAKDAKESKDAQAAKGDSAQQASSDAKQQGSKQQGSNQQSTQGQQKQSKRSRSRSRGGSQRQRGGGVQKGAAQQPAKQATETRAESRADAPRAEQQRPKRSGAVRSEANRVENTRRPARRRASRPAGE